MLHNINYLDFFSVEYAKQLKMYFQDDIEDEL